MVSNVYISTSFRIIELFSWFFDGFFIDLSYNNFDVIDDFNSQPTHSIMKGFMEAMVL